MHHRGVVFSTWIMCHLFLLKKSKVTLSLNYRLQRVRNGGDWRGHREDGGRVLDIDNENEDLNFNDVTRIDRAVGVGILVIHDIDRHPRQHTRTRQKMKLNQSKLNQ